MKKEIVKFQDLELEIVVDEQHEWLIDTKTLASGYEVTVNAIQESYSRNKNEFEIGKHFVKTIPETSINTTTPTIRGNGENIKIPPPRPKYFWTKRGVIRFGFLLKGGRAKLFRDWAEDLIIDTQKPDFSTHQSTLREYSKLSLQYADTLDELDLKNNYY